MNKYFCSFCDKPVDEEAEKCPHCGADLTEEGVEKTEDQFYCTACNKQVKEEDIICPHCGQNLVEMMDTDELSVLCSFENEKEAKKAADKLKKDGIESIIAAAENSQAKLAVLKYDLEKAKAILEIK